MRLLVEVLFLDVLLATVHIGSDIYLIYSYFDSDDPWWGGITIFAVFLPGLLGNIKGVNRRAKLAF